MTLILSGTDGLSDVDGSAATPALRGSDTNTGIFFPAADTIAFAEGGAEVMRIDSSGNVGVGVTPSAWVSTWNALQVKNAFIAGFSNRMYVGANNYFDGSNNRYIATDFATRYYQLNGIHAWEAAPSGTAGAAITFTQVLAVEKDKSLALQGATSVTGTGISFPATQSASSDANTLDDYEEGTWTPVLAASGYTFTLTSQNGAYTKIGNCVTFKVYFNSAFSSGSGSTSGTITGLPFVSANVAANFGGCSWYPDTGSTFFTRVGVVRTSPNNTILTIGNGWSGTGIVTSLNWATSSSIEWELSGHYYI
jgi:hypothetical protein